MKTIDFWFDFASPYAYFARAEIEKLARRHGRAVAWRPTLLWAVLKAQGIAPPGDSRAKWDYLLKDMERSAAFMGLPFQMPPLPFSSHLAARMVLALAQTRPDLIGPLTTEILDAAMARGEPIAEAGVLVTIAARLGIGEAEATAAMNGPDGRALLSRSVEEAVAAGVCGSPFTIADGEAFFGADRLPQIAWWLGRVPAASNAAVAASSA